MKLLIFGASGGTGCELVKQALEVGYEVTAFVRDPDKIRDLHSPGLSVVRGDVLDKAGVAEAVAGHDAVLFAVGAGPQRTTIREEGTRTVVDAMQVCGVKRLICLSSFGVGDSRQNLPFFTRYVIVGIFLRHAFADHERQEAVVKASGLDWTLVRPPHLKDGSGTGTYRHGLAMTKKDMEGWIRRSDLAHFMLAQLGDDRYVKASPGVSY